MTNPKQGQQRVFIGLLILVSLAFVWLLLPFYGAIFWGVILALIFLPLHRWLMAKLNGRATLSALLTLLLVLFLVIMPLSGVVASLINEVINLYQQIKSGDLNFGLYFEQAVAALPPSAHRLLGMLGIDGIAELQAKFSALITGASQFLATQALNVGQNTVDFIISFCIMLYLLFFLLRDGVALSDRIRKAIPLDEHQKQHLLLKFTTVVRATVKGNVAVAAVQGTLGGLIFWVLGVNGALLWGVIMGFLSLLPAVGAALIWAPVAIYFLLTGAYFDGIVLALFGALVIGMVDNVLRPILVGKDTRLPDYMILISTLGGMTLFGINGFVIGPLIAALFVAAWDLFSGREEEPR
ncbi:AI-2E family transporter [Alcaligenaceae bacterium SJ-26]|nr:AI-2E family transporter [Alcaligenaceae bacterium SJ-26]